MMLDRRIRTTDISGQHAIPNENVPATASGTLFLHAESPMATIPGQQVDRCTILQEARTALGDVAGQPRRHILRFRALSSTPDTPGLSQRRRVAELPARQEDRTSRAVAFAA